MSPTRVTDLERRLLSYTQAATYLGISLRSMKTLAAEGEVLKVQLGARVLFDRADLDAFVERAKRAAR